MFIMLSDQAEKRPDAYSITDLLNLNMSYVYILLDLSQICLFASILFHCLKRN